MFRSYKILLFFIFVDIFLFSDVVLERDPEAYQLRRFSDYLALEDEDEEDGDGFVCNEKQLMTYLAKLQVTNPESVVYLATVHEVDSLCKTVENSLAKIDMYFEACQPDNQEKLYKSLVKGVETLHKKICLDNKFKTEFVKYSPCYRQLQKAYQKCSGPADWSENSEPKFVCKTYQDITNCFFSTTNALCGKESANKLKKLVVTVISCMLPVKCKIVDTSNVTSTSGLLSAATKGHSTTFYAVLIPLVILVLAAILVCLCVVWSFSKLRATKEHEAVSSGHR